MEKSFNETHAREILGPCRIDDYITIDERGVWPKVERDATLLVETELLRWRPARVLKQDDGEIDVANTPGLPFPFTARQLAAFMIEGMGALVADFYGHPDDEPDPDSLDEIDPDSMARTAVIQAFAAYREAKAATVIKPGDQPDTDAMVRHLLRQAPEQSPATPAPVAATKGGREKKPTIESVALDYMRRVYKTGQFPSAAKFHKHLLKTAGSFDSPFQKGIGENSRRLFCPAASSFFDAGTLGKIWQKIRSV